MILQYQVRAVASVRSRNLALVHFVFARAARGRMKKPGTMAGRDALRKRTESIALYCTVMQQKS
jgi:hypothetical protein